MSRSAGAGSPVFFRCAVARSTVRGHGGGWTSDITLTGRTRQKRHNRYSARGARSTGIEREYRCSICGHVGWSSHIDLAELERG